MGVGVVRIPLQALVVEHLGLLQVGGPVVERAGLLQRGGQVVVTGGRGGILRDGVLEAVGGLLVVALLVKADAFDVGGLRRHAAAAAGDKRTQRETAGEIRGQAGGASDRVVESGCHA